MGAGCFAFFVFLGVGGGRAGVGVGVMACGLSVLICLLFGRLCSVNIALPYYLTTVLHIPKLHRGVQRYSKYVELFAVSYRLPNSIGVQSQEKK